MKPLASDVRLPGHSFVWLLAFPAAMGGCDSPAAPGSCRLRHNRAAGLDRRNCFRRMASRLIRVHNWEELAEEAGYNAKKLAERCGISLRQLERFIPRATGKPPQQWLNYLRQQKAVELIASGLSVKEASFQLGYKQLSHFSREFKRFHGVAPSELPAADFSSMSL